MEFNGIEVETCYLSYKCAETGQSFTTGQTDNCWVVDMVSGYLARGGKLSEVKVGWRNFWVHEGPLYSGKPQHSLTFEAGAKQDPYLGKAYTSPGIVDEKYLRYLLSSSQGFVLFYPTTRQLVAAYYDPNLKMRGGQTPNLVSLGRLEGHYGIVGTTREQQASLRKLLAGVAVHTIGEPSKKQLPQDLLRKAYLLSESISPSTPA
jgi:hypothetical protein